MSRFQFGGGFPFGGMGGGFGEDSSTYKLYRRWQRG